jgi:phenylacetyl-CoA:acceptor oxidoreductase 26-kDa subunit
MERVAPWAQTSWDHRAAGNFIGGGTGSGLAIVAATSTLWSGEVPRVLLAAAALAIALGLALVWLEIGRPWRFLHVFFHPQTSWMTREALVAPPLIFTLGAAAWTGGHALATIAGVLAIAFLYCQARMLRAARGIPAWREPAIVPLIVATGLAEGAGAFLILALLTPVGDRVALLLAPAAILIRSYVWTFYRGRLERHGGPAAALNALAVIDAPLLLFGTIAPLSLLVGALVLTTVATPLALVAGAAALGAGWTMKDVIVTRAAFNQGFAIPHLPRLAAAGKETGARPGWS